MLGWIHAFSSFITNLTFIDWTILLGCSGSLLYWLGTWTHDYFQKRGLPFTKPLPVFGSMAGTIFGRTSFNNMVLDLYKEHEGHQAFGFFQFLRPTVFIRDPELIKLVTVKEFDHFVDHQRLSTENGRESNLARNLFSLKGQEWRDMRSTLSPAFTSSKMRTIFKLINVCGDQMVRFLNQKLKSSPGGVYEAEMKDFFTRFANDVIATSAFGIECDSLGQPNNEFYLMGRDVTNTSGLRSLIFLGYLFFSPRIMEFLGIPLTPTKSTKFFNTIVHETIRERQQKGIVRPDMLQLLLQAREGELRAEASEEQESVQGGRKLKLTIDDITAQAFIFFFAGFDTVSTGLSYTAYALTRHPDLQEKVQREVDEVFEKYGGNLTYEAIQELKYFDMFINEVFRLYAATPSLDRICTKDFTIPAQGDVPAYTVRKGETVWIPVWPLHTDPKYWDDPQKFDPERFSDENKPKIKPFTYMPFGIGPRICIGSRFALMETKVALAHILRHFSFQSTPKTPKKVEYATSDVSGSIKGGFWVGIAPRAR